jgi:hypothetical protein
VAGRGNPATVSRHCEEPATRQSSYYARKSIADSFTPATGLPRFARNDGEGARNDQAPSLRGACDAAIQQPAPARTPHPTQPQSLDCHASLAMTNPRHCEEPPLAAMSEATWRDAAIHQPYLARAPTPKQPQQLDCHPSIAMTMVCAFVHLRPVGQRLQLRNELSPANAVAAQIADLWEHVFCRRPPVGDGRGIRLDAHETWIFTITGVMIRL